MHERFQPGDQKIYQRTVQPTDVAAFESGLVHPVYATFALARDLEWSTRLFVLEMKEEDEEGIGTRLSVVHHSPAGVGEALQFTATVKAWEGNELICQVEVHCGQRLVATGETGQKILKRAKLEKLFMGLPKS